MWIQTHSHKAFSLSHPEPESVDPETIVHVLSRKERFGGHGAVSYSVARHSLHVYRQLSGKPYVVQLAGLLHDAHEVYDGFGDILAPAKWIMPGFVREWYVSHVDRVNEAIAKRFGFPVETFADPAIHHADMVALATEKRDVMKPPYPMEWGQLPEPDTCQLYKFPLNPVSVKTCMLGLVDRLEWIVRGEANLLPKTPSHTSSSTATTAARLSI